MNFKLGKYCWLESKYSPHDDCIFDEDGRSALILETKLNKCVFCSLTHCIFKCVSFTSLLRQFYLQKLKVTLILVPIYIYIEKKYQTNPPVNFQELALSKMNTSLTSYRDPLS